MADSAFNVNSFKSKLSAGGARPSLFTVSWTDTSASYPLSSTNSLLVKAASLPTSTIAPLVQNYAGRAYKLQGFRTFDNWTVTVLNDEDFVIRTQIKQWMQELSGAMDGTRTQVTIAGNQHTDAKDVDMAKWLIDQGVQYLSINVDATIYMQACEKIVKDLQN